MSNEGALVNLDDDAAIAEIASGTLLKRIAARYGVAKQSLHERLSRHPDWKTAVALQAETFVEIATDEAMSLDSEATMPDIARARVKVDTAHKWAAARDPSNWGQKPANITINNNVLAISDSLVGTASELLGQLRVSPQSELSTVQHQQIAQEIGK